MFCPVCQDEWGRKAGLQYYNLTTNKIDYMQRYRDKVYHGLPLASFSRASDINPHEYQEESSFSFVLAKDSLEQSKIQELPFSISQEPCRNCQRLQGNLRQLMGQLVAIEKSICQKQETITAALAERDSTISILRARLDQASHCAKQTHFDSTFYSEQPLSLYPDNPLMSRKIMQNNQKSSSVTAKEGCKNSMAVVLENSRTVGKKRGGVDDTFCYGQNIPPNSQKWRAQEQLQHLRFENQTLKDYNRTLLAQISQRNKLKK